VFVKAEPGRAYATYEFEPDGGRPVRPGWNTALRRTLCVEVRIMESAEHSPQFTRTVGERPTTTSIPS